ncbi:hypothetical protein [Aquimarina sp. 2201CG5-10]|uniref:hypothetical protein n=1 Tax=Aquimarina callyspongiae TaxID=3098150 RepID=UPI002AB34BB1|nr:hypothetical protein [Aquimarina sp. 2201CG5-10]MDY8137597.1 hypothetical protein [Aquimarina sp. 2201CG5-10]
MTIEEKRQKDLVLYSPSNCEKYSHKLRTIKDVLQLPSKSLADFKRDYGKEWVIGYISMWLINLNDNSNVKTKMGDAQMDFTAERIFETYSLKVTDLTLFFRNIKEGVYGPYYENLSQEKIMEWLRQYFDLRCETAAMYSGDAHEKISLTKDKIDPGIAKEMFKGIGEEEVIHNHKSNGIGTRTKVKYEKAKVVTNRTDYLNQMFLETKKMNNEDLKNYFLSFDVSNEDYDQDIYEMVEKELEYRINPPVIEPERQTKNSIREGLKNKQSNK